MKRQTQSFVVEVKQKRRGLKQSRSIWGDLNHSALLTEETRETKGEIGQPGDQLIDSHVTPIDAGDGYKTRAEHLMADPQETGPVQTTSEAPAEAGASDLKKKAPRPKKAKMQPARKAAAKSAPAAADSSAPVRRARKIYSEKERGQLLGQIEKLIGRGDSIKNATRQAGISEQTYYQWKKSAAPVSQSDELKDLLALEEENKRLKTLLAERLREENAELKKKLGL
ncbi:transposase [Mesorhizobium sp. A556]